jgi:signal transduction histidine kinase
MKYFKIILPLLFITQLCQAQDTTVVLSKNMVGKATDQIDLGKLDGWIFKQGNDTGLAKINRDTTGWKQLNPDQLSSKYADKNGRVEGWFRLKVKFDSSLLNKQIGFEFADWAASEFYIDGKLVTRRGNTGEYGTAFREYNRNSDPIFMRFQTAGPHIFSIHFVGYLSSFPPYELKAQSAREMYSLLGPNYNTTSLKFSTALKNFYSLWMIVCAVLAVLFWLLLIQNPQEKNLFWIALYTSVFAIFIYAWDSISNIGITFKAYTIYHIIGEFLLVGSLWLFLPLLIIKVFKRKVSGKLIWVLIILYILTVISYFLLKSSSLIYQSTEFISLIFVLGICFYYTITSWKNLKGAQWAIVVGLILSAFSLLVEWSLLAIFKSLNTSFDFNVLFSSVYVLAFPLSLLVYVSMRFKEIINEVKLNANRVVELSEEKKIQAENQKKVLQAEVARQTAELRQTLDNLKSTQSQLIQSEKMASLGELTAGIAHEIQNPLNFVNNFSEVSTELLEEMKEEIKNGNFDEVKVISADLNQNLEKILTHGRRADGIVKGMLQHSRGSSGEKLPTDINALADEYLRLSYHGLRAKDKSFNADFKLEVDKSIPKIEIVPQDIGRVLLNLINNAFYAVSEKAKQNPDGYKPSVIVSTKIQDDQIVIRVKDNGNGIPDSVKKKIFQPFFTTKPTGQGTGLGLSLSYDIVKAHGGDLRVETKVDKGSSFLIELPVKQINTK